MNNISIAIELLLILKTCKRISKQELANRLNISTKMVQRLKNQLQLVGYNICEYNGRYGGYELIDSSFFPFPSLDSEQLSALKNAYSYLVNLKNPFLNNDFFIAYQKIIANNKKDVSDITYIVKNHNAIDPHLLNMYINILNNAIIKKQRVEIEYLNIEKNVIHNYVLEPYYLFVVDNSWYMIAIKKFELNARVYKLDRIKNINSLDQIYNVQNVNIESFINNHGFKIDTEFLVKLLITDANYLKEIVISDSQKIISISDNQFILEGIFYNKKSIQGFVATYSMNIKVLSPKWLVDYHINLAQKIFESYR